MKKYVKLNNNDNHFSLGNFFRIIREISINKRAALQSEIFCILFQIENINDTTVNNYCVGCRSISDEYKQIIINYEIKYNKNKEIFIPIIMNLINIIEGKIINVDNDLDYINKSERIEILVNKLFNLAKNDKSVNEEVINEINSLIIKKDFYNALVKEIIYIILYKKQPVYEEDLKTEIIESFISDTSISSNDLKEYLSVKLKEGINYYYSMKMLAQNNNAYACYDLGVEECNGGITGHSRYDVAYNYFIKAAEQNHASSCFIIGYLLLEGLIGNQSKTDLKMGYDYLMKSNKLGNIYSYNSLGNMYFNGIYPLKKNIKKAKELYLKAAEYNLAFAFNNLGKIEESNNNLEEAYKYYLKSANLGESWACNKMGEYYRNKEEFELAYFYYNKGLDSNYRTTCYYNYYNLAKYYYLNGCSTVILIKDVNKAEEYFIKSDCLIESLLELLYLYAENYLKNKNEDNYNKLLNIKNKIEIHEKYNKEIEEKIEKTLKEIKNKLSVNLDIIL